MGNVAVDLAPPSNWTDFERLTLDVCKLLWRDDHASMHGRAGQEQLGVDVFGYDHRTASTFTGVQCKKRTSLYKAYTSMPANTLSLAEVQAEVALAETFQPDLDRFVVATTGAADADLQRKVAALDQAQASMRVSLWFWDHYVAVLNDSPDLMFRYYENVLKYRERYSEDEHYFRLLRMAFDRPAIRTLFQYENRADDFIAAVASVQQAVATGRLVDRANQVIDQVRVPKECPRALTKISKKLQIVRDLATKGLADGRIVQQSSMLEIMDPALRDEVNRGREEAVTLLNELLAERNIDGVSFGQ